MLLDSSATLVILVPSVNLGQWDNLETEETKERLDSLVNFYTQFSIILASVYSWPKFCVPAAAENTLS